MISARKTLLSLFFVLILVLSGTAETALHSLELSVNGSLYSHYTPASPPLDAYRIPLPGGGYASGHSLAELLPLFTSAYRMDITFREKDGERSRATLRRDNLGDLLFESAIVSSDQNSDQKGYRLIVGEQSYPNAISVDVYGYPMESGSLTIWLSWEGVNELKRELQSFADTHGVELNLVQVPNTDTKLTATLRGGGELPDLVMIQSSSLADLVDSRALQRLDYLDTDYVVDKGKEAFSLEGKLWAIPFYFDTQMLFYNPRLLPTEPSAGWSLEEFEEIAGKIKKSRPEIYPACWNAYSVYWLSPFLHAFGKDNLINSDGSITIDDKATADTIDYIIELSERGLLEISERDAMTGYFASGRTAMILTGSYSIPHFRELGIPFKAVPFPVNGKTGEPVAPFLDFKGFAITRRSRSPVLARRFLQHLTGPGVQQRFTAKLSKLPARSSVWDVLEDSMEFFPQLQRSYEQGVPVPSQRSYGIYKNTMWKLLRFAFSGKMGVREVLESGQGLIENKLKN